MVGSDIRRISRRLAEQSRISLRKRILMGSCRVVYEVNIWQWGERKKCPLRFNATNSQSAAVIRARAPYSIIQGFSNLLPIWNCGCPHHVCVGSNTFTSSFLFVFFLRTWFLECIMHLSEGADSSLHLASWKSVVKPPRIKKPEIKSQAFNQSTYEF